jgi:ureidoglycolate hydrolase
MMDEKMLEIREFTGPGYQPVIDFSMWRVAILNYIEEIHPERIEKMERHNETDEVFVLIKGQGILFLGEGNERVVKIHTQVLEPSKIYNVKRSVWHSIVLSKDGSVLIVENMNTSSANSDYFTMNMEQRGVIVDTARREQSDWQ